MTLLRRLALVALAFSVPVAAFAAIERTADDTSATLFLRNDTYMAGQSVRVTRPTAGDVNAAGQSVVVDAAVRGTVQAAGSAVNIRSEVGGNVRAAGGTVVIERNVRGNVMVFGGEIVILSGAVIDGDVVLGGGQIAMDGTINGSLMAAGGKVSMRGTVKGNTEIKADDVELGGVLGGDAVVSAGKLSTLTGSRIGGALRYWSEDGKTVDEDIAQNGVTRDPALQRASEPKHEKSAAAALLGAFSIFGLLSAALVILVLQLLTKAFFLDTARRLQKEPGMSLLRGLLYFCALPALTLLLAVTLIGLPLAALTACLFFISILLAKPLTAMVFARWLEVRGGKKWSGIARFAAALGLYVLLKLLMLVPIVGWIAVLAAVCMAYGALMSAKYAIFKEKR